MDENKLRELFKATNTAEPLCEGWPGLLRFGLAVATAEREECAQICHEKKMMYRFGCDTGDEPNQYMACGAEKCEEAIRARGGKQT